MSTTTRLRNEARFATPETAKRKIANWYGESREVDATQSREVTVSREKSSLLSNLLFVSRELDDTKAMVIASRSVEDMPQIQSFSVAGALKKAISQAVVATGIKPSRSEFQEKLQHEEARIGALVLGDLPRDVHHREFYQADAVTWAWNETKSGQDGQPKTVQVRYHLTPENVYKTVNESEPTAIGQQELGNFVNATQEYARRMKSHLTTL